MPYYIAPPPMNPLTRLLAGVLAVLALVGAFFFGFFILIFALGFGLVGWLALSLRLWWLRRKNPAAPAPGKDRADDVIDAEYRVVSRKDEE